MTNYLLAGGGTGGHVNPLLALAEFIRRVEPESKIWILGTAEGLEARLVPSRGFELLTIPKLPFPRKPNLYALSFLPKFAGAVKSVQQIIQDHSVDVVIGFGGYASAPAYVAANRLKVPYVVHEANALPGMANRLGSKNAAAVAVCFEKTPLKQAVVTGMPLRFEIEEAIRNSSKIAAKETLGLDKTMPTLLVTGGSLGAASINKTLEQSYKALFAAGIQVIHITGGKSDLDNLKTPGLLRMKYCDQMNLAIAASDLAISRSGSSTVSELGAFGLPAVYVPYPVGNGEQKLNVTSLVKSGGALVVEDSAFTADYLSSQVIPLISDKKRLRVMSEECKNNSIADGASRLFSLVQGVLSRKD